MHQQIMALGMLSQLIACCNGPISLVLSSRGRGCTTPSIKQILPWALGRPLHAQTCRVLAQRGCLWFAEVHWPWAARWTWIGQQIHLQEQEGESWIKQSRLVCNHQIFQLTGTIYPSVKKQYTFCSTTVKKNDAKGAQINW